jgi:hypothetical protein
MSESINAAAGMTRRRKRDIMKKSEKFAVLDTIREMEPEAVRETLEELDIWCKNHEDVCHSFAWRPHGNSAARAREADWRTWQGEVKIGDVIILYFSTCMYISLFHYHWTDHLEILGDDMDDTDITFGDIELFRLALQQRLIHHIGETTWNEKHYLLDERS